MWEPARGRYSEKRAVAVKSHRCPWTRRHTVTVAESGCPSSSSEKIASVFPAYSPVDAAWDRRKSMEVIGVYFPLTFVK